MLLLSSSRLSEQFVKQMCPAFGKRVLPALLLVLNNNFHWKFVLLENSRTFGLYFPMEIIVEGNFRAESFRR